MACSKYSKRCNNHGGNYFPFRYCCHHWWKGALGITTVVSNAASSGKVLKINSLTAAAIGATTGVTLQYFNNVNHASAGSTVSIAMTVSVPKFSTLVLISKENSIYLEENTSLGIFAQPLTGSIDVVCSYEEIN